jgi:hypothetical protein
VGEKTAFLLEAFPACLSRIRDGSPSRGLVRLYLKRADGHLVVNASRADEAVQIGRPAVKAVEGE